MVSSCLDVPAFVLSVLVSALTIYVIAYFRSLILVPFILTLVVLVVYSKMIRKAVIPTSCEYKREDCSVLNGVLFGTVITLVFVARFIVHL